MCLERAHLLRLRARGALADLEFDLLVFFQGAEAGALDFGVVNEDVGGAASGAMKPKPFSALNHFTVPVAMVKPFKNLRRDVVHQGLTGPGARVHNPREHRFGRTQNL